MTTKSVPSMVDGIEQSNRGINSMNTEATFEKHDGGQLHGVDDGRTSVIDRVRRIISGEVDVCANEPIVSSWDVKQRERDARSFAQMKKEFAIDIDEVAKQFTFEDMRSDDSHKELFHHEDDHPRRYLEKVLLKHLTEIQLRCLDEGQFISLLKQIVINLFADWNNIWVWEDDLYKKILSSENDDSLVVLKSCQDLFRGFDDEEVNARIVGLSERKIIVVGQCAEWMEYTKLILDDPSIGLPPVLRENLVNNLTNLPQCVAGYLEDYDNIPQEAIRRCHSLVLNHRFPGGYNTPSMINECLFYMRKEVDDCNPEFIVEQFYVDELNEQIAANTCGEEQK